MRPFVRSAKTKSVLRKLWYCSPLLLIFVCFQNFDDGDNSLVDQMGSFKVEEKTYLLHATTLSGAAEEIFVDEWAPEARMFTEKMGEKLRVGFSRRQYDGSENFDQKQYLEPEMQTQVIGSGRQGGASINVVNVDRIRMDWADAGLSCDYNPMSQTVQMRTPLRNKSNLQIEHQFKDHQGRLSWQMSW